MIANVVLALALALVGADPRVRPASPAKDHLDHPFDVERAGEGVATIRAGCARCDWGEAGREAAALRLSVDGRYSQHLVLVRGETPSDYHVTLGALPAGHHRLVIDRDRDSSARDAGPASIEVADIQILGRRPEASIAQSMAPILYARPNTIGRFTDLPVLMWYEVVPTARGRRFRYSVIFTNEDGGTPADRLMATWGRTTDIEFVYGVELDDEGHVVAEDFQGPGHEVPAFKGAHEAAHPLLYVSTDNNMVSDTGTTRVRYAPAPERFDLTNVSREAVMDAHPWIYGVMAQELRRESKIADDAPPGNGTVPDPRRFVYIEACADVGSAALAFAVRIDERWIASDRGVEKYRIVRDGCFRVAVPLPAGARPQALRAIAYGGPVHLSRVNRVFMLDDRFLPELSTLQWQGSATIATGEPFELRIRQ